MRLLSVAALCLATVSIAVGQMIPPTQEWAFDLGNYPWKNAHFGNDNNIWLTTTNNTSDTSTFTRIGRTNGVTGSSSVTPNHGPLRTFLGQDNYFYTVGRYDTGFWFIDRYLTPTSVAGTCLYESGDVTSYPTSIRTNASHVVATGLTSAGGIAVVTNSSMVHVRTIFRPNAFDISVEQGTGGSLNIITREPRSGTQAYIRKYDINGNFIGQAITEVDIDASGGVNRGRYETWTTDSLGHHYFWVKGFVYRLAPDMSLIWKKAAAQNAYPFELMSQNYGAVNGFDGWLTGGQSTVGLNGERTPIDPNGFGFDTVGNVGGSRTITQSFVHETAAGFRETIWVAHDPITQKLESMFAERSFGSGWSIDTGTWPGIYFPLGKDRFGYFYATTEVSGQYRVSKFVEKPVAMSNNYATAVNTVLNVSAANGVMKNATYAETATLWRTTLFGTLTLHSDGSFSYSPSPGFSGIDNFIFRVANPIAGQSADVYCYIVVNNARVKDATFSSTSLEGAVDLRVTVNLTSPAPTGGVPISLQDSGSSVISPSGSWVIPAGASSRTFVATVRPTTNYQLSTLFVGVTGFPGEPQRVYRIPSRIARPLSVSAPASVGSGTEFTCTVRLSGRANAPSGQVVRITSTGGLIHPSTVTVPAGAVSTNVTITAPTVTASTLGKIRATCNGYTALRGITITP